MKRKTDWWLIGMILTIVLGLGIPAYIAETRIIPCDTDTDCMEKNGGNGDPD